MIGRKIVLSNVLFSCKLLISQTKIIQAVLDYGAAGGIVGYHNNFCVLRWGGFVYILYYKGHVNVTKVRRHNFKLFNRAIRKLYKCLNLEYVRKSHTRPTVHNISASGDLHQKINLQKLCMFIKREKQDNSALWMKSGRLWTYKYDNTRFPAFFLKSFRGNTVLLYKTGRFCIVGSKTMYSLASVRNDFVTFVELFCR